MEDFAQHGPTADGRKPSPSKDKKEIKKKVSICFGFFKFQFFHVTPSNFACLIVKTASPGPIVSVPTLGSWKYDDLICKIPKNSSFQNLKFQLFLYFRLWKSFFSIFDLKFGFSTPKYPYGHVPRSVEVFFRSEISKMIFDPFMGSFFIVCKGGLVVLWRV